MTKNGLTARNAKDFAKGANIYVYSLRTLRRLCDLCGEKKKSENFLLITEPLARRSQNLFVFLHF